MPVFSIGLDFGSNSARAVVVNLSSGRTEGSGACVYPGGKMGVHTTKADHNLARQNPLDYVEAMKEALFSAMREARESDSFDPASVIGIGVDTTGSTPIPVAADCSPLAASKKFSMNLNAFAWMWKDHTGVDEAELITRLASDMRPHFLKRCGGVYSPEWFWAKIWHCLNVDEEVFDAAHTWVEFCDFIPATLAGIDDPAQIKRSVCPAGHKALFCEEWGGLPDKAFLEALHPKLAALRDRLYDHARTSDETAGRLCAKWADMFGLPKGIPVAVGAMDAHMGAVGSGVAPGRLVKIIGTSSCDLMVVEKSGPAPEIPGICGIVDGSVIPGFWGLEAGQAAVGDLFHWFVAHVCEGDHSMFAKLTKAATRLRPGESGLLALDWNNGNRCVLVDPRLTGMIVGLTLHTGRAEIFRALIEATAFASRKTLERVWGHGIKTDEVVCCGGIAEKNPLFMQIYADVLGLKMVVSAEPQSCALGSAMFGAVAAGPEKSGFDSLGSMQDKLCRYKGRVHQPDPAASSVYDELYGLYCELHDGFGVKGSRADHYSLMKRLLDISARAKS